MISRYDKLCFESGGYVGSLPDYQSRICLPGHPGKLKFEAPPLVSLQAAEKIKEKFVAK
jgi:hypothetical protein